MLNSVNLNRYEQFRARADAAFQSIGFLDIHELHPNRVQLLPNQNPCLQKKVFLHVLQSGIS